MMMMTMRVQSPQMKFLVISVATSSEPLELKPTLLYHSDMKYEGHR